MLIAINNNQAAISSACAITQYVSTCELLSPSDFDRFQSMPIQSSIYGFSVTRFPLWKLVCLLGETWLEEDVVNALLELLYHEVASMSNSDSTFLVLPTLFSHDMRLLFQQSPRSYSVELDLLRRRIQAIPASSSTPNKISFVTCESDHYSAYRLHPRCKNLELGDSMRRPSSTDIAPAFRWLLAGLDASGYCPPQRVVEGHIAHQGQQSGSCAIAALNFISRGTLDIPAWTDSTSAEFRKKHLQDLLIYHLVALDVEKVRSCRIYSVTSTDPAPLRHSITGRYHVLWLLQPQMKKLLHGMAQSVTMISIYIIQR